MAAMYSGIISRSTLRTCAQPNTSSGVPRTPTHRAQRPERRCRPAAETDLVAPAQRAQRRRVQQPRDLRALAANRLRLRPRLGQQQQAGDFVLVLVRHQLVQVAGDGIGEVVVAKGGDPLDHRGELSWRTRPTDSRRGRRSAVRAAAARRQRRRCRRRQRWPTGSATHARPQANAARFFATATPLSVIARSIRSGAPAHGRPARATPSMNTLTVLSSPSSRNDQLLRIDTNVVARSCRPAGRSTSPSGNGRSGWMTIEPVATCAELATTTVRSDGQRVQRGVVAADQLVEGEQHIDRAGGRLVRRLRHVAATGADR